MINAIGAFVPRNVAFKGAKISNDTYTRAYVGAISKKDRISLECSIEKLDSFSEANSIDITLGIRPSVCSEVESKKFGADDYVLTADVLRRDSKYQSRYLENAGKLAKHVKVAKAVDEIGKRISGLLSSKEFVQSTDEGVNDLFSKYGANKHTGVY